MNWLRFLAREPLPTHTTPVANQAWKADESERRRLQSEGDILRNRVKRLEKELAILQGSNMRISAELDERPEWIPFDEFIESEHLHSDLIALMPSGAVVRFHFRAGREYMHKHAFHGSKLIGKPTAVQVLKIRGRDEA